MTIKLVVVDDHEVVHQGVASLLRGSLVRLCDSAATADRAVKLVRKHKPDVVLLDVRLGDEDGIEAIRRIRSIAGAARVVVFSAFDNPTYVARAVSAGAHDFLLKTASRGELIAAIEGAAKGAQPTRAGILRGMAGAMAKREAPGDAKLPLSPRETQTLRLIAMGLSNKEIADAMEISVETVKEHVQNMLRKTSLNDRTQAAVWAIRNGLA